MPPGCAQLGGITIGAMATANNLIENSLANRGQEFQKCGKNLPRTHRSRDTAHAQWLRTHCQWYPMGDVRTHNSTTDCRRIFRLGGGIDHLTRHV